jgi:hypothetical protein
MYKTWYIRKGEVIYGKYDNGALSEPLKTAPNEIAVKGKDTGYGRFVENGVNKIICFEVEGSKFYAWAWDRPLEGKKPWYQFLGQGTFKGVGLGLEFSKLPKATQWLIYIGIALAIRYVFKKAKR